LKKCIALLVRAECNAGFLKTRPDLFLEFQHAYFVGEIKTDNLQSIQGIVFGVSEYPEDCFVPFNICQKFNGKIFISFGNGDFF